jgi:hypothetical protein
MPNQYNPSSPNASGISQFSPARISQRTTVTPRARALIRAAIRNSLAPATLRSYRATVKQFWQFCDREGIPPHQRTPTPEIVLCAFAADGFERLSGSTTQKKIAALKAWHGSNNWPWFGGDRLKRVITGVRNATPHSSIQPKRPNISIQNLITLAHHLNLNDSLDAAVLACASTAFWGQCRLGELIPRSERDYHPGNFPCRKSIRYSPGNKNTWILNLPNTKTSHRGQDIALISQKGISNPIRILYNHLQVNKISLAGTPLFTYASNNRQHILTKNLFLKRCNQIWTSAGLPRFTGHSFRIGGTTHYLLAGVPPDVVKVMGRWSSDAFLRYWRSTEHIAPLHANNTSLRRYNQTYLSNHSRHRSRG